MRKVLFLAVLALSATLAPQGSTGKEPDALSDLMKKKLEHSQKLLAGIAKGDFKVIAKQSDELMLISKEASWRALKTPRYELYTNEFRRRLTDLREAAEKKNIDAAALAYVDMTLTCVKCHKHIREERIGRLPLSGPDRAE
jgi:hypothetical protein